MFMCTFLYTYKRDNLLPLYFYTTSKVCSGGRTFNVHLEMYLLHIHLLVLHTFQVGVCVREDEGGRRQGAGANYRSHR